MNIDYTALAAWAAVIGLIITIGVSIVESRRSRFSLSVDLIMKLAERFDSDGLLKIRRTAAKGIIDKRYADADDILDFFEMMGMLVQRRALDEQMVWSMFSYWIYHYWYAAKDYIEETRRKTPSVWESLNHLQQRMLVIDQQESRNFDYIKAPSKDELNKFLEGESNL